MRLRRSATQVLAAVNTAISKFGANHVTIVGHSLGELRDLSDAPQMLNAIDAQVPLSL